jgi:hypothetical protein
VNRFFCASISRFDTDDDDDDDDDNNGIYLKKVPVKVSQNLILHRNADQPKA